MQEYSLNFYPIIRNVRRILYTLARSWKWVRVWEHTHTHKHTYVRTFSSFFCQLSSLLLMISMHWDRAETSPVVVALKVTASARISSELTSEGLPPPTENGRDLLAPRGTCRVEGRKANGSLPVRLCPVKRSGSGECEEGGRVELLWVIGEGGVGLTTPSSGILSMDSALVDIPLTISGLRSA